MKIALVSSGDSALDIAKEMRYILEREIVNVEVQEIKVPSALDIPPALVEQDDADLYFVFYVYRRPRVEVKVLLEKLVSLEMDRKMKIVKAVSKLDEDWEKEKLAARWAKKVLTQLFGKDAEAPTEEELVEEAEESEEEPEEDKGLF